MQLEFDTTAAAVQRVVEDCPAGQLHDADDVFRRIREEIGIIQR
ncbi:MAG: hypothetical protein SFX18_16350 [Pirellulales bacterium]|nr:hypothetical protein [Pirellulales bacterium]